MLHPVTGQLLIFNSDINRGVYILAYETDLAVTKTESADPSPTARDLTYTVSVTNNGPGLAVGVTLTDTLSGTAAFNFVSVVTSQGSCSGTAAISCTLASIASGDTITVTIKVRPTSPGTITNTATASVSTDTNTANNSDTEQTTICRRTSRRTSIPC